MGKLVGMVHAAAMQQKPNPVLSMQSWVDSALQWMSLEQQIEFVSQIFAAWDDPEQQSDLLEVLSEEARKAKSEGQRLALTIGKEELRCWYGNPDPSGSNLLFRVNGKDTVDPPGTVQLFIRGIIAAVY